MLLIIKVSLITFINLIIKTQFRAVPSVAWPYLLALNHYGANNVHDLFMQKCNYYIYIVIIGICLGNDIKNKIDNFMGKLINK